MKIKIILSCMLFACISNPALSAGSLPDKDKAASNPPISFTENKGQVYDQNFKPRKDVLFGAMSGAMAFHLTTKGVSYQLYRTDKWQEIQDPKNRTKKLRVAEGQTIQRIDADWVGCNKTFNVRTDEALPGHSNYYLESCPQGALKVKSYRGVTLQDLYAGIDLHYYESKGNLKHDYIVSPHSDYKQIRLKINGATVEIQSDGSLLLTTPLGNIQEGKPLVFQDGKLLDSKWVMERGELGFEIENVNPDLELVIDPVTRLWGTYMGGNSTDYIFSCSTNSFGDVFVAGYTESATGTLIATTGSHQQAFGAGGTPDAFLAKFDGDGIRQWGTYYGGTSTEVAYGCEVDAAGDVFLVGLVGGLTGGTIIATPGSHQPTNSGNIDGFLAKFDSNGIRIWGTYYGSTNYDSGYQCAVDQSGNVYMCGGTMSGSDIATPGSHAPALIGGMYDGYLVKFNGNGVRQWATYYGGTGEDRTISCATDGSGNVFISGYTDSGDGFAASSGGFQQVHGGATDAFLAKFNSSGVRQWGTYYGGSGDESSTCSTDPSGNVYLCGNTDSNTGTVIATSSAHQKTHGGLNDAYLVKFNTNGLRQWGTYYGGAGDDYGSECTTNKAGEVFLTGSTSSSAGISIASAGVFQPVFGGVEDGYLVKLNSAGVRQWGTYYGGNAADFGNTCVADVFSNIFMAGSSSSQNGESIAITGSHQEVYGGGTDDGMLVKFKDCTILSPVAAVSKTVCEKDAIYFSATITGAVAPAYSWSGPGNFTSDAQNPVINNASASHTGIYTITITDEGCVLTKTVQLASVSACTDLREMHDELKIAVYPNPNQGTVQLHAGSKTEYILFDVRGKKIKTGMMEAGLHEMSLENIGRGVYFLHVRQEEKSRLFKLIRE